MKTIYSSENKIYKLCIQLAAKKYRDRLGLYLIEGENLLAEAVKNAAVIEHVIFSESFFEHVCGGNAGSLRDSFDLPCDAELCVMSDKLFMGIAQTKTPQGMLAVVKKPELSRDEAVSAMKKEGSNVLILDRLQDPGNIGTIIRTADAAGFGMIISLKGTVDVFSPKVIRAAMGSVFRMPIFFAETPQEVLALMKECKKRTAATCFDTDCFYYDADIAKDTAIIIGNEGNGICREFSDGADIRIKIPMHGNIESLNAAVAAAILMYEAVRKGE